MKRLIFFLIFCSSASWASLPQMISVCNNTPIGNGMSCYASNSQGAGSTNSLVNFSAYPASATVVVAAANLNYTPTWHANDSLRYSPGYGLIDSNGNLQVVSIGGTSGSTQPIWNSTGTTVDGTVTWDFLRTGRIPPDWKASDISNTQHSTWTFIGSFASGVEDGDVVQYGIWIATVPASGSPDTITMSNPDSTNWTTYGIIYTGFDVLETTAGFAEAWGGPTLGNATTGNYAVTKGDANVAFVYSDFPYTPCGWNTRTADTTPRGFIADQLAISTTANAQSMITNTIDGYYGIGFAWKPKFPTNVSFTAVNFPIAQQGVVYASTPIFTITGGTAPYTCSLQSGSLPGGMSVTTSGNQCLISGTPSVYGDFTWTEKVTDNNGGTFSGNPYFVISTPTLPTFTGLTVTPFISSATVTWTSNVPTNSQVCFTSAPALGYNCAYPIDQGGTTSHSVAIFDLNHTSSWLTPGTTYTYYVYQQGFVSTVWSDYLQNTTSTATFVTRPATSAGSTSFTCYTNGPFDVIQGSTLTVPIMMSINTGTGTFTSLTINVFAAIGGVPDGNLTNAQVYWPYQQTLGFPGTVGSTYGTNSTLVFNNVADVLNGTPFQMGTNIGGTTPVGNYLIEFYAILQPGNLVSAYNTEINVYAPGQTLPSCTQTSSSGGGGGGGSTSSNCTMYGGFTFKGSFQ